MNDNKHKYGNTSIGTDPSLIEKIDLLDVEPTAKEESTKKNSKLKMIIIIIVFVLLIGGIGFGTYFYLHVPTTSSKSKNKVGNTSAEAVTEDDNIKTKDVTYITGYTLPTNVSSYIEFKNNSNSNCSLDTSNVNTEKAGEYKFYVTCSNVKYTGKVTVYEKESLSYTTSLVYKTVGEEVAVSSLISGTNMKFDYNEAFPTESGLKTVPINLINENETASTVYGLVYLTDVSASTNLICTKQNQGYKVIDRFNFDENNKNLNQSVRMHSITYEDEEDYYEAVSSIKDGTITLKDFTGNAYVNNSRKVIVIVNELTNDTLLSENDNSFPDDYDSIKKLYESKEYTCR